MVIGEHFAWAHLPKTGGDATCLMFGAVPGLVRFADPLDSNAKHEAFFVREAEVAGKLRVMNIRRLPSWLLSGAHHRARWGLAPDYEPQPLQGAAELAQSTDPDNMLRWMTDRDRLAVERWLRCEELQDDVLALLGELNELSDGAREGVLGVGRVNTQEYERDVHDRFTAEQIEMMYERNPQWAEVELRVYGSLMGR